MDRIFSMIQVRIVVSLDERETVGWDGDGVFWDSERFLCLELRSSYTGLHVTDNSLICTFNICILTVYVMFSRKINTGAKIKIIKYGNLKSTCQSKTVNYFFSHEELMSLSPNFLC